MTPSETRDIASDDAAETFIAKWNGVAASELSTSQSFLIDLCHLLGVDTPHPTPEQNYMFERPIVFAHGDGSTSPGRIDLYRRGAFVLESKKLKAAKHTKGFDEGLLRARTQAEQYARALPADEGRPPFVVVVDVGNRIELYAEFSRSGATYTPIRAATASRWPTCANRNCASACTRSGPTRSRSIPAASPRASPARSRRSWPSSPNVSKPTATAPKPSPSS